MCCAFDDQSLLETHDSVASQTCETPPSSPCAFMEPPINSVPVPADAIRMVGIRKVAGEHLVRLHSLCFCVQIRLWTLLISHIQDLSYLILDIGSHSNKTCIFFHTWKSHRNGKKGEKKSVTLYFFMCPCYTLHVLNIIITIHYAWLHRSNPKPNPNPNHIVSTCS